MAAPVDWCHSAPWMPGEWWGERDAINFNKRLQFIADRKYVQGSLVFEGFCEHMPFWFAFYFIVTSQLFCAEINNPNNLINPN